MVVVNNRSSIVLGIGVGIGVDDFLLAAPSVGVAILQESYCKRHLDIESVATGRRDDTSGQSSKGCCCGIAGGKMKLSYRLTFTT